MFNRNPTFTKTIAIPEDVYVEAKKRATKQRVFEKSHRKNEANEIGCLGEVIAERWMKYHNIPFKAELEKTTHDYILTNGLTIDVKTKDRTVRPKSDYDNSAPLYNHSHQKPDYFLFISLERNKDNKINDITKFHTAYILGAISYTELDKIGIPFLEGEKDWRNGTKFWTDCLNVEMWQLIPLRESIDIFRGIINSPTSQANININLVNEMRSRIKNNQLRQRDLPSIPFKGGN